MSLNVDDDEEKPTAQHPSIPLDLSGNDITWDQNFANVHGRISRLMDAFERDGTFSLLFSHRAAYHGGRIYVESAETVNFITGKSVGLESYDYRNVCPPTPMRIAAFSTARRTATSTGNALQLAAMGADLETDFFTKPLDGKKFHAMRRLIMNEASDAEAAKIRAYLASAS